MKLSPGLCVYMSISKNERKEIEQVKCILKETTTRKRNHLIK